MGCQGSRLKAGASRKKDNYKLDQKKDEVSSAVESGEESLLFQRRPSLQGREAGAVNEIREEETLQKKQQEPASEKQVCCEKSSVLPECNVVELNTQSAALTHCAASAVPEEKEAEWVDNNRAHLIQSVTTVMEIADKMIQWKMISDERYAYIRAAVTSQEKMRQLFDGLRTVSTKSALYRILKNKPNICETEDVKEVIQSHKDYLRNKYRDEFEGTTKDHKDAKPLDKIYTELHIIQGESERVNNEHEIWEIEDKTRSQTGKEGTKINCNGIFETIQENNVSSGQDGGEVRAIRTVMTKGIAGIGKTVSVKKFILDWAEGNANHHLDFIFVLPFRELNLVIDDQCSLETLVRDFHPELKNVANIFDNYKVLFIFDGLDESQLQLNFKTTKRLTDPTKESSVDTLVTNLIRKNLLPSAFVWITSRPGAVQRIPREYIYQWTEVRGFSDPQKTEYFRKRVEDEAVAERIIDTIKMSRSLYIMCHIPIFCWISAKVLAYLLLKVDDTGDESILKIPTTLTEMYTHFLWIQMQVATEKYEVQNLDTEEIFRSNKEFILKLGRMAFEHLNEGKIIFTGKDLTYYGIDIHQAGINCGLFTEIFKEESVFIKRKHYCFVHLTVQEYFAALFVYHSFASKKIDSLSLKDFLLHGSEEELKPILEADPVELPLNDLLEISIANSTLRKTGELDMFLRFLIGMSLQSTQELLQDLIQQTEEHSVVVKEVRTSLTDIDLADCSPARCLNLVHCLIELKDSSLHDAVRQYLNPSHKPETQLSPAKCSALADLILMSKTPLDEFNLKKYRPSARGIFRLVPAIRNSRKVRISGVALVMWLCETIASALQMPNSVVTELHLTNNIYYEKATKVLIDGLKNSECKLEALSLSGNRMSEEECEELVSVINSNISNLRELELSGNILRSSVCSVLSNGLCSLERLRLNRNPRSPKICKLLVSAVTSCSCRLQELEMNYNNLTDSEMEILCTGLKSTHCTLKVLSLTHNRITEKGCEMLASTLGSMPSCLTNLDLSYNELRDTGVKGLCGALMTPHCRLKTLRLSFCKVTADGCAALASALRSAHCSLRELDLSFNHLADQGVEMLTEIQRDSCCSLEELNVDQNEEFWFDLRLLRHYACDLTLDPDTAGVHVILSEENKKATYDTEKQSYPDNKERFDCRQVLCKEGLTDRHYWEVERVSADVGVAYKSMDRKGDCSSEFSLGKNEKSWCWFCEGTFYHNYSCLQFMYSTNQCGIGVYLDWPAGILSFFEVCHDTLTHLYTVRTTFTEPLHPGFHVHVGSIYIRKIEKPEHTVARECLSMLTTCNK